MKKERRGYLRVDDVIKIEYRKPPANKTTEARTIDIGGGGIKLVSSEDIPVKTRLSFNFELPNLHCSISCTGEVRWKEKTEDGKYQLGISFLDLDEETRQKVIRYCFIQHYKLGKEKEIAIEVERISKYYDKLVAVNNVSFKIRKGEIFALLGPNGAGKTTTTRILSTLLLPSSGSAKIFDYDIIKNKKEIRKLIGYMPQNYVLYDDLTARENLEFFGKSYSISKKELQERIDEALAFTELEKRADSLFRTFSGGMKQRLSLACTLIHRPEILFLDEPTAGVDLRLRKSFWDYFHALSQRGVTIFVTTHQMDEVEHCYRVAFMQNGKIIIDDTPDNIKKMGVKKVAITTESGKEILPIDDYRYELPRILKEKEGVSQIEFQEQSLEDILREKIKGEELRD